MHAHAVRLPVLRDPGQEERDRAHDPGRNAAADERGQALEPLPRQREPAGERDERREQAPARVREHERDQERVQPDDRARANDTRVPPARRRPQRDRQPEHHHERERVPVPDRRPKPRQPPVVLVQRGHGLSGQGPEARHADERADQPGADAGRERRPRERPHDREREVGEPAVEVVPRAVRQDRPEDRDTGPDREPAAEHRERDPLAPEPGQRQQPPERERARAECDHERRPADPRNRPVARPPAEQKRRRDQRAGRTEKAETARRGHYSRRIGPAPETGGITAIPPRNRLTNA